MGTKRAFVHPEDTDLFSALIAEGAVPWTHHLVPRRTVVILPEHLLAIPARDANLSTRPCGKSEKNTFGDVGSP